MKMKTILLLVIVSAISFCTIGQPKGVAVSHYIFPAFMKGTVLMKTGLTNEAMLNYNLILEEMISDTKGTKLALNQLDLVDTVFVADRKFVVFNKKFIELLYHSTYELYAAHKCKIKDSGKPAAYGGTSQISSAHSFYFEGEQLYELALPVGIEIFPSTDYWLKKDGKMMYFINLRQLSKVFSTKEEIFTSYVKKNEVKYENEKSIIDLIRYLETN